MPDGKQPFASARADGAPLVFAGLWETWLDPAGDVLRTFTIATTAANDEMATLHDRMPVILEPYDLHIWLGAEAGNPAELLRPATPETVRLWPVSRAVNSAEQCRASARRACVQISPALAAGVLEWPTRRSSGHFHSAARHGYAAAG